MILERIIQLSLSGVVVTNVLTSICITCHHALKKNVPIWKYSNSNIFFGGRGKVIFKKSINSIAQFSSEIFQGGSTLDAKAMILQSVENQQCE